MLEDQNKPAEKSFFVRHSRQTILALAALCAMMLYFYPDKVWYLVLAFVGAGVAFLPLFRGKAEEPVIRRGENRPIDREGLVFMATEALRFPAYVLDRRGVVRYANDASVGVFGPKRTGEQILIRFRQPDLNNAIDAALSSGEAYQTIYFEAVPSERWFSVEIAPIPDGQGRGDRPSFYLLCFHDQTEARRTDRMRSDFIANASHELRTPLASLLGYIETLKGPARNDKKAQEKFLDVMLDQAERMSRLVNDLLSLSKIEMKAHVKPAKQIDLTGMLTEVVRSLEGLAAQMNVEIRFDPIPGIQIIGDRDELVQVFENLIENACKYGQDGGKVDVGTKIFQRDGEEHVLVSVTDYGPGIAEEHQQRITERFYRIDVARSREKQGTGLGLAIVKHILNRHQTRLELDSEAGKGATFKVRFQVV